MNIWIFNRYAITPDLPGGTRHFDLSKELAKRGHRVVILAASFHHQLHKEMRLKPGENWKIEDVDGIRFIWLRTTAYQGNDWRRVRSMVVYMLRAWHLGLKLNRVIRDLDKPDVIIGSSPDLLIPLAAYLVSRRYRVPFLMEVRDLWPQTLIDMGGLKPNSPVTYILRALEVFLYKRARKIISVLPLAYKYMIEYGIPTEKIIWIPNGIDISRFSNFDNFKPSENEFKVIYLGSHGRANALDVLIKAARIIQDKGFESIKIYLIGDGPEKASLIKLAEDLSVSNIYFHDPISKSDVIKYLNEASALLISFKDIDLYFYGISPNKLYDYMAAGKPIISSLRAKVNPVEEARCGINVPPMNPEAMAEAIIKLYEMPEEEREAMGERGRAYVEQHHDIVKLAIRLEEVLKASLPQK